MSLNILHTNDMHGTLSHEKFERLRALRLECDLFFDTGDAIKTGNLGIPLRPESVWKSFSDLRCTASVLGNRESHILTSAFEAKIRGASHPILCANLRRRDGSNPLASHLIVEAGEIRIGLVGVMVPMVTARMKTQIGSAFLWDSPIKTALEEAEKIRAEVDALFALTHIGWRQDQVLAETGAYAVIFGGHSHSVLQSPHKIGTTWVVQGGSHNRFAGKYQWDGSLSGGLISLND